MNSSSVISVSPSFTCNSSNILVDTADGIQELRGENGFHDDDIFYFSDYNEISPSIRTETVEENEEDDSNEGEQEFEFAVACRDSNSYPISASEIFSDGQIYPRYPLFGRSLFLDHVDPDFNTVVVDSSETESKPSQAVRLSLRKLFSEDRDSSSSSSSEAGDLEGIAPGTYCVWTPKTESTGKHKKSYSTGNTSNRWKVRDLLRRSYSDENYSTCEDTSLVVFTTSIATKKQQIDEKVKKVKKLP